MQTVCEPKAHIKKFWREAAIRKECSYRLLRYTMRVEHNGEVLLHNLVTGQLVVLSEEEDAILRGLPAPYQPLMDDLIALHFLVPVDYDEHKQVANLRKLLYSIYSSKKHPITSYIILPTTACNARCYYCYEQNYRHISMTEETAEEVVRFIGENCGDKKKVKIRWFGGEPTVGAERIDGICRRLSEQGISYTSTMTTNGYLFDEEMVAKAKTLWHLERVNISVDGTEENYNRIKAYPGALDNPYRRVLRNVGLLVGQGIRVSLRMNFDVKNASDFEGFVNDVEKLYGHHELINLWAFPVGGEHPEADGCVAHGSDEWLAEKEIELNRIAENRGFQKASGELPCLQYLFCAGTLNGGTVITPEGNLACCMERFEDPYTAGTLWDGVDRNRKSEWASYGETEECADCPFYPQCVKAMFCPGVGHCNPEKKEREYRNTIKNKYEIKMKRSETNGILEAFG